MASIGNIIDGKYEILKEIGRGGMSIVYLAMDKRLNKQWAIKQIRKKGKDANDEIIVNSLIAEANMMKRLDHPALPRIVDIIDTGDTIYIVMDYIEGESLDKVLFEYGAQPEELVLDWAKQLCDALSYLHAQKPPIIYRDMKPANVMLKPEGNLKIIDFGIAREYKDDVLADTTILGTNGYAAPEQYGARQTDARTDIYGLGMTMHNLLTGIDPRPKDYVYAPVRQWNPQLSEGIEIIIDKCTAPAMENRYQNANELMYDLEHPDLITKDYKRTQKRRFTGFAVAAGLAGLLFLTGLGTRVWATSINNNDYDKLVNVIPSTDLDSKVDSYEKAISIYPANITAYQRILEAYEDSGQFGKEESDLFLAVFNANRESFDQTSPDLAELNYKLGMMYFNYYSEGGELANLSTRIQKAYPFFEANFINDNIEGGFTNQDLSDCYYQICSFYRKYILNSTTVEEASKADYDNLLDQIDETIETIKTAGAYDQLSLYNGVFMLLNDQRSNMASTGVEEDRLYDLLTRITDNAASLVVQKPQSQALQEEILANVDETVQSIHRSYNNVKER